MAKRGKRYQKATIKALIDYLDCYDLEIVGPCMQGDSEVNGMMNYDIDDIMKRIKLTDSNTMEDEKSND